jgi:hypothetical protein
MTATPSTHATPATAAKRAFLRLGIRNKLIVLLLLFGSFRF